MYQTNRRPEATAGQRPDPQRLRRPWSTMSRSRSREGEIVGLTGLIGSGSDALPYLLYGARPATGGEIEVGKHQIALRGLSPGRPWRPGSPSPGRSPRRRRCRQPVGRRQSVAAGPGRFPDLVGIDWPEIARHAKTLGRRYDVRPNKPELNLGSLSGGNAQKVLMAKCCRPSRSS